MSSDLSSLLSASKGLTSHLSKLDLPSVNLSLDQIEAQSRRLVSRHPVTSNDADKANYLLAQARVDASGLSSSIAHLNATSTFTPLQAIQDTDVAGYLRHAHEQNLISTIEEGRRETQEAFYQMLEDRMSKDWEAKKKRVFEELGARVKVDNRAMAELKKSFHGKSSLLSAPQPTLSLQMQSKMMAYDRVITELNASRLRGTSFPIIHALIDVALSVSSDSHTNQLAQTFHVLSKITQEPSSLPPPTHASSSLSLLNTPSSARKFSKAYLLSSPTSREAIALRKQIASGAREALEEQYFSVIDRTIQAHSTQAQLGGDPTVGNKIRAFLAVRYYRGGEWEERIELVRGQPVWARMFFLVRTGHAAEAAEELYNRDGGLWREAIEKREAGFVECFRMWVESPDRKIPKNHRDHLQSIYNAHMLHSNTTDPFKLALYKLIGKLELQRRSVPHVTTTTEDWLWFQLAMLDEEDEGNGLKSLAQVLLGYGERHFDGQPGQEKRGVWAGVLLMCGEFERAVAALWEHQETEVEAVHLAIALAYHGLLRVPSRAETSDLTPLTLSPINPPALNLSNLIWRYIRQFVKMDAKEALQYVYCVCLSADQGDVGREQVENAWELVRRILVLANAGPAWEELVGGFRPDGTRFTGTIEQFSPLLNLPDAEAYSKQILVASARAAEENDRICEAIKLYNLAGDYNTVISCLAQALGNTIAQPSLDERAREIERTAVEILRSYERTNRGLTGGRNKEREAVGKLLRVREAMERRSEGRSEVALEILESIDLVPLEGDVARITRRAEDFKDLHETLQRNLPTYLTLIMDVLAGVHQKVKNSMVADTTRQATLANLRKKSRSLMIFAGLLKYRMSPDVYSYLARLDVEIAL
ncbi:nucleoporin-interacting protein nic96 [Moniliophthora roreri]|uniref:Nuclear pore protein n=1 Tax=Moniliophthora roreri TaxID=221103 RepID=A0A0W0FRT3_MONRR|nr:nucleoporin-interacting protein nic96 [Moniliophthora roreri]